MPIIALIIIGAAAGFLAARVMRLEADIPTTVTFGIFGALLGGFVLRVLITATSWAAGFIGAFLGAVLLIWLWRVWIASRRR
jgi:uncharacterized membrane protein YeaQ/YmgE (transglycosylase-associated protein family)